MWRTTATKTAGDGRAVHLAHMLRMTGELRAEGGVPPAKAAADLGLRQVPRPQTMTVSAASRSAAGTPGDNVEVMAKMVT